MTRKKFVPTCAACALVLSLTFGTAGCASKQEKALEQAKKQAIATGQPQQVVSVDKNGITTTSVVQPPPQGQKEPTVVTTTARLRRPGLLRRNRRIPWSRR